ncbi:hypothetical protein [Laceyella putida]|uniref:DNA (cytosine-5-)-methyltransferase n=1 Tax=Laceyella putida TaxID=110101 RepID=A0ABW2RQV6_9BACL
MKFKVSHLFCGSGGGAVGFGQAREEWRGMVGTYENVVGMDADPEACADFRWLTGAPAEQMALSFYLNRIFS